MVVSVAPRDLFWDYVISVPVEQGLRDETLVVISKEVPDVPVAMVLPLNLLVQRIVCCEDQLLRSKLVGCNIVAFGSCRLLDLFISDNERLVRELALVDEHVSIAHA